MNGMEKMDIEKIVDLLIKSVHSDKEAAAYFEANLNNNALLTVLLDIIENSESGDARMEASFFVSKFDENLLKCVEKKLLQLMNDEWMCISTWMMIALSRIKSQEALKKIIREYIKPEDHWIGYALENYCLNGDHDDK